VSELVGVFGVQHNPLLWRALDRPEDPRLQAVLRAFGEMSEEIRGLRPDVLVMLTTDHLNQWFYDNMPTFLVGMAEAIPAIFPNEEREFGITPAILPGDPLMGAYLLAGGIAQGIDFAASDNYRADHSIRVPLHFLVPRLDVPIVPIFTNAIAPPFPTASRFFALGRAVRAAIERAPLNRRVIVLASGHLATEVGGPRQFSGSPDIAFDRAALRVLTSGVTSDLLALGGYERLAAAGNVTHQFLNFVAAAGVVNGRPATRARVLESAMASAPFFSWTGEDLG
jgi:aromatic ring-opening dioxygenase catalytic subunit (LigB family)